MSKDIISTSAGRPYGHVPGHHWLDADLECEPCGSRWLATITISAGSAQESHGRNDLTYWEREYTRTGSDAEEAISRVMREALGEEDAADIRGYVETACSRAIREACNACDAAAE